MVEMILALESIGKGVFLVLVNTSLQATLLIFLVWSMIRIFCLKSAVARYYLWFLAVFGVLALPMLSVLLPGINIPMMRSAETTISPIYARSITVGELTSDITPLVENKGLGAGDEVDLEGNPLNDEAYKVHFPALAERGVKLNPRS